MPTVLLVRHGRTTANASGTLAGWSPGVGLDDTGRGQARSLGERIRAAGMPLARLVVSPLQRCLETADELGLPEVPRQVEDRLGECRYGAWTGRPLQELAQLPLWRVVQDQPSAAVFPDGDLPGESISAMSARAVAAIREADAQLAASHGPRAVWLAVSHGDIIKAILADALGSHLDQFQRIRVDPASVSVVHYTERRPFVLRLNDLGGSLAGLVPPEPDGDAAEGDAVVGGGAGAAGSATSSARSAG